MNYEKAKIRLANHANMPNTGLPMEESLVGGLWLFSQQKKPLDFEAHVEDILDCLRVVNFHFNGPDPETRDGPSDHTQIGKVAYYISAVVDEAVRTHLKWTRDRSVDSDQLDAFELSISKITCAWTAVLAGDITDILESFVIE